MMSDSSPADDYFSITPNDSSDLTKPIRGISIGTAGAVKVTKPNGNVDTLTLPAGGPFPLRIARVWATGTTATGLVGYV